MTNRHRQLSFVALLLLTLVGGASAGVVATVLLNSTLDDYAAALLEGRRPATPSGTPSRSTPSSYSEALARVKEVSAPSVAVILPSSLDSRLSGSWVGTENALGYGVVVSTDGWVLVHQDAFAKTANALRGAEVWIDGIRYTPTQYVVDTVTDFAMVKISANGLMPVAFASTEDIEAGEPVFVLHDAQDVLSTTVSSVTAGGEAIPLPAEQFDGAWGLATKPTLSSPVFSSNGDLYAMTGSDVALPMHQGVAFVREVMRTGTPAHAGLGATVVEISRPLNIDATMRQEQDHGALVTNVITGPGATAGLAVGDIIISVDDVRVDAETSLAELLRLYDPGQSARLGVVRDGQDMSLSVTFGDYADLLY